MERPREGGSADEGGPQHRESDGDDEARHLGQLPLGDHEGDDDDDGETRHCEPVSGLADDATSLGDPVRRHVSRTRDEFDATRDEQAEEGRHLLRHLRERRNFGLEVGLFGLG